MGCGFAISPVVGVMTQDKSTIKGTLYIFISGLHFMRTATLKVTFKTHGYTHGYILHSWLHFTPGYTYGYILHSWLQSWLHLTLMPTPTYALGHGYILRSWLDWVLHITLMATLTHGYILHSWW